MAGETVSDERAPRRLVVGRIVRAHGLSGELVIETLTDTPSRFAVGERLHLGDPDASVLREVELTAVHAQPSSLLVHFQGVATREQAEALRGSLLSVPLERARALAPGEYWPHQLVGLQVVDRQEAARGIVLEVVEGTAHDLLSVQTSAGHTALVPLVAALVRIELEHQRVVVDAIPGLLDPDA